MKQQSAKELYEEGAQHWTECPECSAEPALNPAKLCEFGRELYDAYIAEKTREAGGGVGMAPAPLNPHATTLTRGLSDAEPETGL